MSRTKQIPSKLTEPLIESFLRTLDERNVNITSSFFDMIFQFTGISVEILGTVYEQYRAKNHENRKADGVYYTPQYIVDYIVENTVGKLIEGKPPKEVAKLKIIDPSCGCGIFLLGVYQYLLDWHRNYYLKNVKSPKERKSDPLTPLGKLTTVERKRILLNNIFGVDIDPIAVELAKFSLLLKCMEGETSASIENTQRLFHEKVLPNIDSNIKCGNSLIGNDFYQQSNFQFSEKEQIKINAFDWEHEFPQVFKRGGKFDAVIGNPPWGQKSVKFDEPVRIYFEKHYPASTIGILDLFRFFIEKVLCLIPDGGIWGQVLPDIVLMKNYESTRRLILDTMTMRNIDHWGTPFSQVNIEVCTLIGHKEIFQNKKKKNVHITIHQKNGENVKNRINQTIFSQIQGCKFNILLTDKTFPILERLSTLPTFKEYFAVHEGIHTGNARQLLFVDKKIDKHCKKLIFGRNEVKRYDLRWGGQWVRYTKEYFGKTNYANLGKPEFFETKKLVIRRTGSYVLSCIDESGYYFSNNVFVCLPKIENYELRFFLGILNSTLLTWYYQNVHPQIGSLFPEIKINLINEFPVPRLDLSQKSDKAAHDKLVSLVATMLDLKKREKEAMLRTKTIIERQIASTDAAIDEIVYQLYGLTNEEIAVVEHGNNTPTF